MNPIANDILMHYGVSVKDGAPGRGSGRYALGSGKNPFQRPTDFLDRVDAMHKEGKTELEIANEFNLTTTQLRIQKSIANNERRAAQIARIKELEAQGYSRTQIAHELGFKNESSIRSLMNEETTRRKNQAQAAADQLKKIVDERGMIDVGEGAQYDLNISKEKMREALEILAAEGYPVYGGGISQVTNPGRQTSQLVLCPPGTEHKEIYDFDKVHSIKDYIYDNDEEEFRPSFVYPESIDSSRIAVRYREDGGASKDGVIEIRRGVEDLDLGNSHYAQVRILVDGDRYLKGMALYSDDIPEGYDILFNTNKSNDKSVRDVLKEAKTKEQDPDNPFGALIKNGIYDPDDPNMDPDSFRGGQSYYYDKDGNKKLSAINKTKIEGDWNEWSDSLPSQFLSKQKMELVNKQLKLTKDDKLMEFNDICELTNPTVKKKLLMDFAEDCDSSAVHLQAAALPRQKYQVILPLNDIKDNEVYAPNYENGEKVALIRYPHAGTFEIPILTVNNKNPEGKKVIGNDSKDAVGINSHIAERLSGADFDGDTVMVIPTRTAKISSKPPLKDLEGFDAKLEYGGKDKETFRHLSKEATQTEMGKISNLITDMTLRGATDSELARAVKHSMVVIDANKHDLDYKQSELDNGIKELKKKYQGHYDDDGSYHEGAGTLISRAKGETSVLRSIGSQKIDPETGEAYFKRDTETYEQKKKVYAKDEKGKRIKDENGNYVFEKDPNTGKDLLVGTGKMKNRMQKSTQMADTKDAYTLVSDARTPQELAYADYANFCKSLANSARKEYLATGNLKYDASAKKTYEKEYKSLEAKLLEASKNAPREREAQRRANEAVNRAKEANPDMTTKEIKKKSQQALEQARNEVGAKRKTIDITEKEWEAIQAGAITENKLSKILRYADGDQVRQYSTPRGNSNVLSAAKQQKIKSMKAMGYTNQQIADAIGVSASTVNEYS